MAERLRKPRMEADWDENRRVVHNHLGHKFVLGKKQATELFNASNKVYHKHKMRAESERHKRVRRHHSRTNMFGFKGFKL